MLYDTEEIYIMPDMIDYDGDVIWHTCTLQTIQLFGTYENKTKKIHLFPTNKNVGFHTAKCQLHDLATPPRVSNYIFTVRVVEDQETLNYFLNNPNAPSSEIFKSNRTGGISKSRNIIKIVPFIKEVLEDWQVIVEMGYPLSESINIKMIDNTLLDFTVHSNNTDKLLEFSWYARDIGLTNFTLQF